MAWDDCCAVPFPGLDRLLVAHAELQPRAGREEIERLIDHYPSQRGQALRAKAILLAREAGREPDLARLDEILAALPAGQRGFLAQTQDLRARVHAISAAQAQLATLDRPFLRLPYAELLMSKIETFEAQIAGFAQPLAREFRLAARAWLELARRQAQAVRASSEREPVPQVFRAGDPVDREREAFLPRTVLGELEQQVLLATGCPGLILYGRRRTGKSTILRNLPGFLPPAVQVAGISLQNPRSFTSLEHLVEHLHGAVRTVVPELPATLARTDLIGLEDMLGVAQAALASRDQRLLLYLDEYENLDRKIGEHVFPEDLLALLRESIQTHRQITWVFAGSHSIHELEHAPWTSYLVSARTVEVPLFLPAETRLLLTEPLHHSTLWPQGDPRRPRFVPGFWGEGGIERIHAEAAGWPHLVQLLAGEVVDLVNRGGRSQADPELLENAITQAVSHGETVLSQLLQGESTLPGEWAYLSAFRHADTQPPPADEAVARSLRRRLLVDEENDRFRLRVPLLARWLRQPR